jgi:hypothetical protein
MNRLITFIPILLCVLLSFSLAGSSVFDKFKISTRSADVYNYSETSLKLESQSPTYQLKLEPNSEGAVMFSLGRYGYATTLKVKDLSFAVIIEGYREGEVVIPVFNTDDTYKDVIIDKNYVLFRSIYVPIPVLFNTPVDSIKLKFSNSYSLNVHQYLSIEDMKVVGSAKINANPLLVDCDQHALMIGIDGSTSIDKLERKTIAKQLLGFFKKPPESLDSNAVCIMEFGKQVHSYSEAREKKDIVKNIRTYKKGKEARKTKTSYTNWAAAFDQAIERQPDIFIFITDRWSNYGNNGPASFNAQYQTLIEKCNMLKAQGTRLLFITSGLNLNGGANSTLYSLLNQHETHEIIGVDLTSDVDLKKVDLISMDGIDNFERIDLSSLLDCGGVEEVVMESPATAKSE